MFYFHPDLFGEDEPILDDHIVQRGWLKPPTIHEIRYLFNSWKIQSIDLSRNLFLIVDTRISTAFSKANLFRNEVKDGEASFGR